MIVIYLTLQASQKRVIKWNTDAVAWWIIAENNQTEYIPTGFCVNFCTTYVVQFKILGGIYLRVKSNDELFMKFFSPKRHVTFGTYIWHELCKIQKSLYAKKWIFNFFFYLFHQNGAMQNRERCIFYAKKNLKNWDHFRIANHLFYL